MPQTGSSRHRLLALFTSLACCNATAGPISPSFTYATEGSAAFTHQGETYQTYYKVFGDIASSTQVPLVVLHGGPGVSHDYLLPLADLANDSSIPIVFYDQLGSARSTHLPNKSSDFWTIDLFIDELSNLITHLSIQDSFSLIGHSWGGVLASEFEVRKQPLGLKRLVLTNTLASSELWAQSTAQLMQTFPKDVQEGISVGMADPKRFGLAMRKFNEIHGCIVKPPPKEYIYSFDQIFGKNGDITVASASILQDWSIIDHLHLVRVPTLVINGGSDIAQDFVVAPFYQHISDVKWITFEHSSHTPFWEERERYMGVVGRFLTL